MGCVEPTVGQVLGCGTRTTEQQKDQQWDATVDQVGRYWVVECGAVEQLNGHGVQCVDCPEGQGLDGDTRTMERLTDG